MSERGPIRVLHIFNRMDRGGAETWIVNVMRHIDRERFQFDFLVESDQPGAYDDEIRALGGGLYHAGSPKRLPLFARAFRRIVREHGPYDVVHSHVHHASGFMLALAASCGVPIRIAHSHTDTRTVEQTAGLFRRVYYRGASALLGRFATAGLAASRDAAASLFGVGWKDDPRWRVLYCGIDLEPFNRPVDREEMRARFGMPADAFVVGHVGRFEPVKNHGFLINVFGRVHAEHPEARLLLVGDGPLRVEIERKIGKLGLADAVVFAGIQANVPEILMGTIDVFVLPSQYEGIPLALIEAQAAGLPCIVSSSVSTESIAYPELVHLLNVSNPQPWADAIAARSASAGPVECGRLEDQARIKAFGIQNSVAGLQSVYELVAGLVGEAG